MTLVARCPVCGFHVTATRDSDRPFLGFLAECPTCQLILEWDHNGNPVPL